MKLHYRRLVYGIFVLLFLIIAPSLALYTAGYRFNLSNRSIERTGAIAISTEPSEVGVLINQEKVEQLTPFRLNNILPGEYDIEINTPEYYGWHKKLKVVSNLTTFLKDLRLIKKQLPTLSSSGNINLLAVPPNSQNLIFSTYDQLSEEKILLKEIKKEPVDITGATQTLNGIDFIEFSPHNQEILLGEPGTDDRGFVIVKANNGDIENLNTIDKLGFTELHWDTRNQNLLYGLRRSVLYRLNRAAKTIRPVLAKDISSYLVSGDDLLYTENSQNECTLNYFDITDKENKNNENTLDLPGPCRYNLLPYNDSKLILYNLATGQFFIVDINILTSNKDEASTADFRGRADAFHVNPETGQLLFYNDFEMWAYSPNLNQAELITRYGQRIDQAEWHPDGQHIIYIVDGNLRAIELDDRDVRNDFVLVGTGTVERFAQGDNETIYFIGTIGHQKGLFELEI